MIDAVIHIIAPERSIAQAYARRVGKFPHFIADETPLRGLRAVEVFIIVGDAQGAFDITTSAYANLLIAAQQCAEAGDIEVTRVRL